MPAPVITLHAVALPVPRDNVDTDELIPVSENTRASKSGWGDGLFAAKRYLDGTGRTPNPDFILNQKPFCQAKIVVSGSNFGCGSSRESAVWALRDYGFRAVVAISFNETFKRNCIINGLAPLSVSREAVAILIAEIVREPIGGMSIDLQTGSLHAGSPDRPGQDIPFDLDPFYAALLTSGRTEDDMLGALQADIDGRRDALDAAWPWLRSACSSLAQA